MTKRMTAFFLALILALSACSDHSPKSGNEAETTTTETEATTTETEPEAPIGTDDNNASEGTAEGLKINEEIISELGLTFSQLTEKYGEPHGIYNMYGFGEIDELGSSPGYGRYCWKSDGRDFDDMETAGGCNMIMGVKVEELFSGLTYPISIHELADRYDFLIISVEDEVGMDNCYWAELTYPLYDNISFIFATQEYDSINTNIHCTILMNVDCLEAVPVILGDVNKS